VLYWSQVITFLRQRLQNTKATLYTRIIMYSSRFLSIATTRSLRVGALSRAFSSECAPAEKLRSVFEEYRQEQ
jgi:hypothetical protein